MDINDVTNCYMIIAHYIYIYAGPSTGEDHAGNLLGPIKEYTGEAPKIQVSCKSDFSLKK